MKYTRRRKSQTLEEYGVCFPGKTAEDRSNSGGSVAQAAREIDIDVDVFFASRTRAH